MRYSAFGEMRYLNGETVTDLLYTGQKLEEELGLYYYIARWYDPYLNRFLSPDSIIPDPGSTGAYDRYAYANNNPIRYNDPSGHYSEDLIIEMLGQETWDEVLVLFEFGGEYEGKWGFLEVLRRAEDGDQFYAGITGEINGVELTPNYQGRFISCNCSVRSPDDQTLIGDHIFLRDENGKLVDIGQMLENKYAYELYDSEGNLKFSTYSYEKYYHASFDPEKVDWVSAGLNAASVGLSLFGANSATQYANMATNANKVVSYSSLTKSVVDQDLTSFILSSSGVLAPPGLWGGGIALGGLIYDLSKGLSISP